ncbi:MAG TPA: nuclear transport factor 2 family protein [Vicinamibacterales bacterium]|jgi:hypothetical protein|nr:nuclear transport factor 2 family protein [Vicinamibacterales bacterium]
MTRRFVACALSVVAIAAAPALLAGQDQKSAGADATAVITKMENEAIKAGLANDPAWYQKYLASDFTGGTSQGTWDTKPSLLADMKDTKNNNTSTQTLSDLKVRQHGDLAIATYSTTYDGMYHGEKYARTVLCTDTFQHQSAGWMLMAGHCSEAAKK